MARRQAVPYVNGVRLTVLLDAVFTDDEHHDQYPEWKIGLEPENALLPSRHYLGPGRTVLLRCNCGDAGCSQVVADISVDAREVVWANVECIPPYVGSKVPDAPHYFRRLDSLRFDRAEYELALQGPRPR